LVIYVATKTSSPRPPCFVFRKMLMMFLWCYFWYP
jgi:hypothetical protein